MDRGNGESWIGTIALLCLAGAFFLFPDFLKFVQEFLGALMYPIMAVLVIGYIAWAVCGYYAQGEESRESQRRKREHQKQIEQQWKDSVRAVEHARISQVCLDIRKLPKYQTWRDQVFEKWGYFCEHCGNTESLEIHHRKSLYSIVKRYTITDTYIAIECDALWNVNNGTVLCKLCHEQMDSSKQRSILSVKEKLN